MKLSNYVGLALVVVLFGGTVLMLCPQAGIPVSIFIDPASALIVIIAAVGSVLFGFGWGNFCKAFSIGFGRAESATKADCLLGMRLFHTLKTVSVAAGFLGTLIGVTVMLGNLAGGGEINVEQIGLGFAVALITVLYSLVLAYCFFLPLARNCENKAAGKA